MSTLILQGANISRAAVDSIAAQIGSAVKMCETYSVLSTSRLDANDELNQLRQHVDFDINRLPDDFNADEVGLLVTDMDSTLISIECIDEIADFLSIKPQVAEITEAAMRGEIDFETSLTRRVALLEGLEVGALERVYNERLTLNPGAETMIAGLKQRGIKVALVSGGFTFFTERLKARLGLDYTLANTLEIIDGKLSGRVVGDIVGAKAKATLLKQLCNKLGLKTSQTIAMGDGANDLEMMAVAGLSIAYHAKPAVQLQADTALNHAGLEGVLGLLRYPPE
ncbi:MAG: phosphoserine phosphatase SerB [Gammaproteobacteria bacterium]|nr:phosphoserine phosphatase SerB [Gammaproteobacteria bacterium]